MKAARHRPIFAVVCTDRRLGSVSGPAHKLIVSDTGCARMNTKKAEYIILCEEMNGVIFW